MFYIQKCRESLNIEIKKEPLKINSSNPILRYQVWLHANTKWQLSGN